MMKVVRFLALVSAFCFVTASYAAPTCPGHGDGQTAKASDKAAGCKGKAAEASVGEAEKTGCHKGEAVQAGDKEKEGQSGGCPFSKSAAAKAGCGEKGETAGAKGCCKSKAACAGKMPKMAYKVGDFETCCSETATAKAKETEKPIVYLVSGKEYQDKSEATDALATAIEASLKEMLVVNTVKEEGEAVKAADSGKACAAKYEVGGVVFGCKKEAEQAVARAEEAIKNVHVSYKVDGKVLSCPSAASAVAKGAEKPVTYVVGDQETCCDKTAKVYAAQAKYAAAMAAISNTQSS